MSAKPVKVWCAKGPRGNLLAEVHGYTAGRRFEVINEIVWKVGGGEWSWEQLRRRGWRVVKCEVQELNQ